MTKKRKYRTPEEKLMLVKEHLIGKKTVSEICEKHEIAPSQLYSWQADLFENGAQCFDRPRKQKHAQSRESQRVKDLENKLTKTEDKLVLKNEVVAELLEAHMKLKKSLGEH